MKIPSIVVSAVVFRDGDGRLLTVRKRGTGAFMLPGGKPEPGEDARGAAVREVWEELGVRVSPEDLLLLGTFTAPAANEPGQQVVATVFAAGAVDGGQPTAEIEEVRWLEWAGADLPEDLAPLLVEAVVPLLRRGDRRAPSENRAPTENQSSPAPSRGRVVS